MDITRSSRKFERKSPDTCGDPRGSGRPGPEPFLILVVEDDPPTLLLEQTILKDAGYLVQAVCSGEEALRALERNSPALVTLDIDLPGMDGFATFRQLRETWKGPVVLVSGRAGADDIRRGLKAGADGYLAKPFSPEQLVGLVHRALDAGSGA